MDEFYNSCRACTKALNSQKNTTKCAQIFETPEIAKKFTACISVEISIADEYPKFLCACCYRKVNEFYQFREMCRESIQHFEVFLRSKKSLLYEDEIPISLFETQSMNCSLDDEQNNLADISDKCVKDLEQRTNINNGYNKEMINAEYLKPDMSTPNRLSDHEADCDFNESTDALQCVESASLNNKMDIKTITETCTENLPNSAVKAIYRCDSCTSRFLVEHRLVAHKREHEGLIPYPCTKAGCSKAFNRWNALARHLRQHEGHSFQYACDQAGCDKVYKHKPTLVMHQRKCHRLGPELKTHICEICGKVFKTTTMLHDHQYTHRDKSERPHVCEQPHCTRRFANKDKLKVHLMRHAGIKNYVCPHCGARKTTMNELKVHINYHTLERTWPCRFCAHVCNSAGNLKTHIRAVHERVKDYACRHCERTFAKPDTRKYHEMTHTGEKPNECAECGKRFLQPAALRTHRKIHQRVQSVQRAKAKNNEQQ